MSSFPCSPNRGKVGGTQAGRDTQAGTAGLGSHVAYCLNSSALGCKEGFVCSLEASKGALISSPGAAGGIRGVGAAGEEVSEFRTWMICVHMCAHRPAFVYVACV